MFYLCPMLEPLRGRTNMETLMLFSLSLFRECCMCFCLFYINALSGLRDILVSNSLGL